MVSTVAYFYASEETLRLLWYAMTADWGPGGWPTWWAMDFSTHFLAKHPNNIKRRLVVNMFFSATLDYVLLDGFWHISEWCLRNGDLKRTWQLLQLRTQLKCFGFLYTSLKWDSDPNYFHILGVAHNHQTTKIKGEDPVHSAPTMLSLAPVAKKSAAGSLGRSISWVLDFWGCGFLSFW